MKRLEKNIKKVGELIKQNGLSEETFCFAPYINLDLDQSGKMYTCYRGKQELGNWKQSNVQDEFNNDDYKKMRQSLYDNQKHENCASCWMAESNKSISPRQRFFDAVLGDNDESYVNKLLSEIKKNPQISKINWLERIEIRTSALCNLRCMHCGPANSTQWIQLLSNNESLYSEIKEYVTRIESDLPAKDLPKIYKSSLTSDSPYSDKVKETLAHAKIIQFSGGEPLLDPQHMSWLKHLQTTATNQILDYNSNLNISDIEKYFELWQNFKMINLRVSIDSAPSSYAYFRRLGDFDLVSSNIKKIKDYFADDKIFLTGSITFNMFSALRWNEIFEWWNNNKIILHSSLVLEHPTSAIYLPDKLKYECIEQMQKTIDIMQPNIEDDIHSYEWIKSTQDCLNFLKNNSFVGKNLHEKTKSYLHSIDQHTELKTCDFFPELEEYLWTG